MATISNIRKYTKISANDFSVTEELLEKALILVVPEGQSQRQAFEKIMPYIYGLRNKGCSFSQIADLLNHVGFTLQPSTVRIYYGEMLADRLDICQQKMNEQILLMHEVKKQTKSVQIADLKEQVENIMNSDSHKDTIKGKLESMLGKSPKRKDLEVVEPDLLASRSSPAKIINVESQRESQKQTIEGDPSVNTNEQKPFINIATNHTNNPSRLKCALVPEGVKMLDPRPNVDKKVYEEGDLEHPYLPGLLLSLRQRLSSVALEFINIDDGTIRLENSEEKRFRVAWKKRVMPTPSSTMGDFTKMDMTLFTKKA